MSINRNRVRIMLILYLCFYLAFWVFSDISIISGLLNISHKTLGYTPIVLLLLIIITQFTYEVWVSIYVAEINWKTTLFPLLLIITIGLFENLFLGIDIYTRKIMLLCFLNLEFICYSFYEWKRIKKFLRTRKV